MTTPRKGRRNPELLTPLPVTTELDVNPEVEHQDLAEMGPEQSLLFEGDVVTSSATLAVILPGDSKESYFGYKVTTRVQDGENHAEVYERLATVVTQSVIAQIDDTIDALGAYSQDLEARGLIPHS